jgi:ABC-type nickel/cobalt efflux system permease component RcnA
MSNLTDQQIHGVALLLLGIAALILGAGIAWTLSRASRTRQVESAWLVVGVGFVLLVAGIVFCWFGISTLVEGQ